MSAASHSSPTSFASYLTCCQNNRVTINVGGEIYETQLDTLDRFPGTLLSNKYKREKFYDKKRGEYYFDRNRLAFAGILYFYQSNGRLIKPFEVPEEVFDEEVSFFNLPKTLNPINCSSDEEDKDLKTKVTDPLDRSYHRFRVKALNDKSKKGYLKMILWSLLEYPFKSWLGKLLASFDIAMICVSLFSICCETMPSYKAVLCKEYHKQICIQSDELYRRKLTKISSIYYEEYFSHWTFLIELLSVVWFSLRYILRFYSCPFKKKEYLLTKRNLFDLFSFIPLFVQLIYSHVNRIYVPITCAGSAMLSFVNIFRVIRVGRLIYYVRGLRAVVETMRLCSPDLINFVLFNLVGTIFFACLVYSSEEQALIYNPELTNPFESAPDTFWWALITLTTVGYGDYVPCSPLAKLVGCICLIAGAFTVSLPVPIIAAKFQTVYKKLHGQKVMLK